MKTKIDALFDYTGYSEQELQFLCDDKNCNPGKASWRYWTAELYSFGKYIRKYGFYPQKLPLFINTDHGPGLRLATQPCVKSELETDADYQFYHHLQNLKFYRENSSKRVFPLYSPFVFCRHTNKINQLTDAKGTLFFLCHSLPSDENNQDFNILAQQLRDLPEKYQPVCVTIHMHDIRKEVFKVFQNNGIPVYTAGNTSDIRFADRFYDLLKHFKYSASNTIGSHTYYSIEMGVPFFIYGNTAEYENFSDPNLPNGKFLLENSPIYNEIKKEFLFPKTDITQAQKKIAIEALGLNTGISRYKMFLLLWIAFFKRLHVFILDILKRKLLYIFTYIKYGLKPLKNPREAIIDINKLVLSIENYYKKYNNTDYNNSLKYIKQNGFSSFPFEWTKEYKVKNIEIFDDPLLELQYVLHKGKKLYFPNEYNKEKIKEIYLQLLLEQDTRSSHKYLSSSFFVPNESLFLDIGCAEAFLALEMIDIVKEVILIETDTIWIPALQATFANYLSKIKIINKAISSKESDTTITLDSIIKNYPSETNIFIKADIEGYEKDFLKGAQNTFRNFQNIQMAICCYHHLNDKTILTKKLRNLFTIEYSDSYMIWPWLTKCPKYHRKYFVTGVIRATRKR